MERQLSASVVDVEEDVIIEQEEEDRAADAHAAQGVPLPGGEEGDESTLVSFCACLSCVVVIVGGLVFFCV